MIVWGKGISEEIGMMGTHWQVAPKFNCSCNCKKWLKSRDIASQDFNNTRVTRKERVSFTHSKLAFCCLDAHPCPTHFVGFWYEGMLQSLSWWAMSWIQQLHWAVTGLLTLVLKTACICLLGYFSKRLAYDRWSK